MDLDGTSILVVLDDARFDPVASVDARSGKPHRFPPARLETQTLRSAPRVTGAHCSRSVPKGDGDAQRDYRRAFVLSSEPARRPIHCPPSPRRRSSCLTTDSRASQSPSGAFHPSVVSRLVRNPRAGHAVGIGDGPRGQLGGAVEALRPWLDAGIFKLYCVETNVSESGCPSAQPVRSSTDIKPTSRFARRVGAMD